ncbi:MULTISPECIES: hypothetical protein [Stenotrophomonas]|uniref:hypothetical protein n=1 Tax=Stenotrophomonas TaxID=40323 RepID=UPI000AF2A2C4|nr:MULTISPECIES: hypothetical protein [Stenotrophomonas]MDH0276372.1 hypothetical protein [Stenotrophomonas sp. GD04089]MDH1910005.1 hypothetical protein [Stenotrophomonas sp. GD03794]VUM23945.1 hypothetical protein PGKDCPLP_03903 [Stenotrophomonas maltophilia]
MNARVAAVGLLMVLVSPAVQASDDVYVELLWSPTPADAIARSVAYQFVADGLHDHRICVAAGGEDADVGGLELTIRDANGVRISQVRHDGFRGRKTCFPADLGTAGTAGTWTVDAVLGDGRTGKAAVRVDHRLEESPLYLGHDGPYVAGRPNYDPSVPAAEWVGKLVWVLDVDAEGKVTRVEVEVAEGVGERLRARAMAAGWLSQFGPDPARATKPLRWRRTLEFAAE